MQKVGSAKSHRVAKHDVDSKHRKPATKKAQASRAPKDGFGTHGKSHAKIDAGAIERNLFAGRGKEPFRTGAMRLQTGNWNGKGNEPTPLYFSDLGKPSDFWKAALQHPDLAPIAAHTSGRIMLSVRAMEVSPKGGFNAQIEIYPKGKKELVDVHVPAGTGLAQLANEPGTNRKPVLPLPVGLYTKEGSSLGFEVGNLAVAEKLLGLADTAPIWNPRSEFYDKLGDAKLKAVHVMSVDLTVYGDVQVTFKPSYPLGRLELDPLSYNMLSPETEAYKTVTVPAKKFFAAQGFLDELKPVVARALGD